MYEPMPGSQKSLSPISSPSIVARKNQPPAMLIMLFQTRPMVGERQLHPAEALPPAEAVDRGRLVHVGGTERTEW